MDSRQESRNSNTAVKVNAVIPFYNEARFIEKIIEAVYSYVDRIILVDDGSTDGTKDKIKADDKIILISYNDNRGKGHALNVGFRKSFETGADFTVTLDADLQHKPEYIPLFLNRIKEYDIVIGNRLGDTKDMPLQRIMSNRITSFLLSLKTGVEILDSQCGYRIYRTSLLNDILPESSGFEAESEILVNAARKGLRIGFVNVPTVYADETSKMRPVEAIMGFLKILFI